MTMRSIHTFAITFLGTACLGLALAGASSAQTFSLSSSASTAKAGDTVTFTMLMTPAPGGSSNLFAYDTNIFVNSAYLQFVGGKPFTPSSASLAAFPNTENTTNTVFQSGGSTVLRLTYDNNNSDAAFASQTALGSFAALVLAPLPTGGTAITFGAVNTGSGPTANNGGSEMTANFSTQVLKGVSGAILSPAAVPEPSGSAALTAGAVGLGVLAVRRRRVA